MHHSVMSETIELAIPPATATFAVRTVSR